MAQQFPGTWKNCATCNYWTGKRECDRYGMRVTVGSAMEKGKCGIPRGGAKGQIKQANTQCRDWQKWSLLK